MKYVYSIKEWFPKCESHLPQDRLKNWDGFPEDFQNNRKAPYNNIYFYLSKGA